MPVTIKPIGKNRYKVVPSEESKFTFPELKQADAYLSNPRNPREKYIHPGDEESAFGSELLKDKTFRKELRKLQEKHKLIGLA